MKRTLLCTLAALLVTMAPAVAQTRVQTPPSEQVIKLELTRYGATQNAEGLAKIELGATGGRKTPFGIEMVASVPDGTEYLLVVTTRDGKSWKLVNFTTAFGAAVVKLSQEELGPDVQAGEIDLVSVHDAEGIVLYGHFTKPTPKS